MPGDGWRERDEYKRVSRRYADRRKKKDWVIRAIPVFGLIGFLSAIGMLVLLERARPTDPNFFSRYFNAPITSVWNTNLLRISLGLLFSVLTVCALGLLFNVFRHRRKSDRYNKFILILGALSLLGIAAFFMRFYSML